MTTFKEYHCLNCPHKKPRRPAMKKNLVLALIFSCFASGMFGQNATGSSTSLVQFSGVVLDQDSLTPIPYVSVVVKNSKRATISDIYGFFTIVVNPGEELQFNSITHK